MIISILVLGILFTPSISVAAAPLHVADLIENTLELDGQTVEIGGEAIGDILMRGQSGWANILDQGAAIGVWATSDQLQKTKWLGSYKQRGDTVRVVGVFHRACSEHGGEPDIHATELTITAAGGSTYRPVERAKVLTAVVLVPATLAVVQFSRRANRRETR